MSREGSHFSDTVCNSDGVRGLELTQGLLAASFQWASLQFSFLNLSNRRLSFNLVALSSSSKDRNGITSAFRVPQSLPHLPAIFFLFPGTLASIEPAIRPTPVSHLMHPVR